MKKNNILFSEKISLIINIVAVIIIIVLAFVIFYISDKNEIKNTITHDKNSSYVYTNPILDCEVNSQDNNIVLFSKNLISEVEKIKDRYSLGYISLYFRDLNNGPWSGVNEKEIFSPASLLKVPVLISLLHQAEHDSGLLDKKVIISPGDINNNVSQNIVSKDLLAVNKEYTLLEVAKSMIEKSDNTGVSVILKNINTDYVAGIFKSVGVPYEDTHSEVDVRVKDYAGFFRVLYNASYLNREMSEKALEMLSKSEYKEGIVAGVPSNITVSHKFGERSLGELSNDIQLHDCGIVYYPEKPYILCVMTRGSDFKNQAKAVADLSKYIYTEVGKDYIND